MRRLRDGLNGLFSKRAGILFIVPGALIFMDCFFTLTGQDENYWKYFLPEPFSIRTHYEERDVLGGVKGVNYVIEPGYIPQYVLSYTSYGITRKNLVNPKSCFTPPTVTGPHLYFSATCVGIDTSRDFSIDVFVNSDNHEIHGVSAYLTYDTTKLELLRINNDSSAFKVRFESSVSGGIVRIGQRTRSNDILNSGSIRVSRLNFRTKTSPGMTYIGFALKSPHEGPSKIMGVSDVSENNLLGNWILRLSPIIFLALTISYFCSIWLAIMFRKSYKNWVRFSALLLPFGLHMIVVPSWITSRDLSFAQYFLRNFPMDVATKNFIGEYSFYIIVLIGLIITTCIYDARIRRGEIP